MNRKNSLSLAAVICLLVRGAPTVGAPSTEVGQASAQKTPDRTPSAQWGPTHVAKGPLSVSSMNVKVWAGKPRVSIELVNHSDRFLCMSTSMLDTGYQYIRLFDSRGKVVPVHSFSEPSPGSASGVKYEDAFLIIRPRETRSISVNGDNFETAPGNYKYETTLLYFRCSDMLTHSVASEKAEIETFAAHASGSLVFPEP